MSEPWRCDYCGGLHPDDVQVCPVWQAENPGPIPHAASDGVHLWVIR